MTVVTRNLVVIFLTIFVYTGKTYPNKKLATVIPCLSPSYIEKKNGAFIYQKIPTEDSTDPQYVAVWYLGERAESPLIRYQDGTKIATLTCYENCQYVRWINGSEGWMTSAGRIRVTNDPLIYSIMCDATAGFLN